MQVCKYFPVASDRMGMIWTISSIEGACIIEFGPAGTTHFAIEGIGSLNGEEKSKIYSTHMDQGDVTFGKYDRLENSILEIDENINPKYIFVMASSVSSVIGADVESVCSTMQDKVKAKLIPITTAGLKYDYTVGVENTLLLLINNVVKSREELGIENGQQTYNIIGSNIDRYNFLSDTNELERIMDVIFDKKVNTTFTAYTSIDEIERTSMASLNIVTRKEGLKAAMIMDERYGIPYIYANLYGLKNTIKFIEQVKNITSWEVNEENLEKEIESVKNHLFSVKRRFYFYEKNKDAAVFGDYDTVIGMSDLLNELGINIDRKQIIYKTDCEDETIIASDDELDRMKYLRDTELLMLLGDGVTLYMKHNSKFDLQISNPNLHRVNIYPSTPYIGFKGCLLMIEKILNIKL